MFGATHADQRPRTEDVAAKVKEYTGGRQGADYVFVTVGVGAAAEQAISLMRRNGAVVLVGMPPSGVTAKFDPGWIAADGQRILGSKMGSARLPVDVPRIVDLYRQKPAEARRTRDRPLTRSPASTRPSPPRARRQALRNVLTF